MCFGQTKNRLPPSCWSIVYCNCNRALPYTSCTVLFYLSVQRGAPDAEQFSNQSAVVIRWQTNTDYLTETSLNFT